MKWEIYRQSWMGYFGVDGLESFCSSAFRASSINKIQMVGAEIPSINERTIPGPWLHKKPRPFS